MQKSLKVQTKPSQKTGFFCVAKRFKQITVQHLNVIFLVLVMAIYKKAFTFVGFGSCLGASRSTGVSGLVLILNTTNTSGVAPPFNEDPSIATVDNQSTSKTRTICPRRPTSQAGGTNTVNPVIVMRTVASNW